jgi:hypothetical protein
VKEFISSISTIDSVIDYFAGRDECSVSRAPAGYINMIESAKKKICVRFSQMLEL